MTARVIPLEFLYQPAYGALPAVTLGYAWSSFMNTYAVWPENSNNVTITRQLLLPAGNYYVTGAVDNQGVVYVNNQTIPLYNFAAGISRTEVGNSSVVAHPGGYMNVTISAVNLGGPRGVAVTISECIKPAIGNPYVGNLVWNTRAATTAVGRYQAVMPFRASVTAHVWGGGGGGGGMDAGTQGGIGAPGLYNTRTFTVEKGDLFEVFIGTGGGGGGSSAASAGGGRGGSSRLDPGNLARSFNGGAGSAAGPKPFSGGGGGGGGASGILVNNTAIVVAAGGGGGGGAGNDGNGAAQYARRDASINNFNDNIPYDYRGENGQPKGGDGGGAGGGGGGFPGGNGGNIAGGDASGFAGQCGGNFPYITPTTGADTAYYKSGFARGGARGGGNGQAGRVYLQMRPLGLISVKIGGSWKQVTNGYVKIGGSWKNIDKVFVKIGDNWKQVNNSGQGDFVPAALASDFGVYGRSWSPLS